MNRNVISLIFCAVAPIDGGELYPDFSVQEIFLFFVFALGFAFEYAFFSSKAALFPFACQFFSENYRAELPHIPCYSGGARFFSGQ